jgi:Tetracyclin repressor-like, C-terminal domain
VYRRWGSLSELTADVASSRFSGDIVVPDTGTLRGDLERWAVDVAKDLEDPDVLAIMRSAIGAAGSEGGSMCVADRHAQLSAMLERERSRRSEGESTVPDVEQAADALLGPLYYRAIFTDRPAPPDWARELVGALLD